MKPFRLSLLSLALSLLGSGPHFLLSAGQNAPIPTGPPAPRKSSGIPRPTRLRQDLRRFALLHQGDFRRGQNLFADEQRLACSKCHTVDGRGGKAGPDLFAVGDKFGRREIIDSILTPSATIAVGYSTTSVETSSGEEYQGIIKQATESWIELMGADAKPVRISNADIKARRTSDVSLMPEGLEAGLSDQEFTDLIEYLVSLKQPESAETLHHGMPAEIPVLAEPILFRQFIGEDLKFEHPVWFAPLPGVANAFLVAEHESGNVWRLEKNPGGDVKALFAELGHFDKGTRGLLGLALHPDFKSNRKYYYAKHIVENGRFATLIFERRADPDGKKDSGATPRLLLKLDALTNVHYGGGLQFGPDGYFYIGMGDTGPQEDPQGNGQNTMLLLGKMLRIDVDHSSDNQPYRVPADNPFVGSAKFRPEIWAYGFREPWRFSFDPVTKELWVGDVGQDRYEEVDLVRRGENYGWNVYEGFERFSNRYRREGETFALPVFAYRRKYGPSVTGGFVYRARPNSSFYGVYIFGDYESRRVWGLTQTNRVLKKVVQIGTAPQRVVSFGQDKTGELYVVGYEGLIYRLELNGTTFR